MYQIIFSCTEFEKNDFKRKFRQWLSCGYALTDISLKDMAYEYFVEIEKKTEDITPLLSQIKDIHFSIPYPSSPEIRENFYLSNLNREVFFELIEEFSWALSIMFSNVSDLESLQVHIVNNWFDLETNLKNDKNHYIFNSFHEISEITFWNGDLFDDPNHCFLLTKEKTVANKISKELDKIGVSHQLNSGKINYFFRSHVCTDDTSFSAKH